MKKLIFLFALSILTSCGGSQENQAEDKWYVGGTLHTTTLKTWKSSTNENKLATCADYVANIKDYNGDLDQMKTDATEVMKCIDEVALDDKLANQKTNEMAASCVLLLGITK